jgi:hypothetical protein
VSYGGSHKIKSEWKVSDLRTRSICSLVSKVLVAPPNFAVCMSEATAQPALLDALYPVTPTPAGVTCPFPTNSRKGQVVCHISGIA